MGLYSKEKRENYKKLNAAHSSCHFIFSYFFWFFFVQFFYFIMGANRVPILLLLYIYCTLTHTLFVSFFLLVMSFTFVSRFDSWFVSVLGLEIRFYHWTLNKEMRWCDREKRTTKPTTLNIQQQQQKIPKLKYEGKNDCVYVFTHRKMVQRVKTIDKRCW